MKETVECEPLTPSQIGNVAIFLLKGGPKDHYDFLELYLRAWAKTAGEVYNKCFQPSVAGKLLSALRTAFKDDEEDDNNDWTADPEVEYSLHNPRFKTDPSRPVSVLNEYYNRSWHPYDWYVRANTEVRVMTLRSEVAGPRCLLLAL
jgi:hypothetical protein